MIKLDVVSTPATRDTKTIYSVFLNDVNRALRNSADKIERPLRSVETTIADTLRSHLGVYSEGHLKGVASGSLRDSIKVTGGAVKHNDPDYGSLLRGDVDLNFSMRYVLDMNGYGYSIGSPEGYTFNPPLDALVDWMELRGFSNFYYYNSKNKKTQITAPHEKSKAKKAAYMMLRKMRGKKNIVLPDWYDLAPKDIAEVKRNVRRTANLLGSEFVKELKNIR